MQPINLDKKFASYNTPAKVPGFSKVIFFKCCSTSSGDSVSQFRDSLYSLPLPPSVDESDVLSNTVEVYL